MWPIIWLVGRRRKLPGQGESDYYRLSSIGIVAFGGGSMIS
jgi:hypothetical protein